MEVLFTAIFGAVAAFYGYKANKTAVKIDKKTATNHGMEPWQYLEMILEIKEKMVENSEYQHNRNQDLLNGLTAASGLAATSVRQFKSLQDLIADHTRQDEANFKALADLIKEKN